MGLPAGNERPAKCFFLVWEDGVCVPGTGNDKQKTGIGLEFGIWTNLTLRWEMGFTGLLYSHYHWFKY